MTKSRYYTAEKARRDSKKYPNSKKITPRMEVLEGIKSAASMGFYSTTFECRSVVLSKRDHAFFEKLGYTFMPFPHCIQYTISWEKV